MPTPGDSGRSRPAVLRTPLGGITRDELRKPGELPPAANSGSSPVLDREGSRLLAIGGKLIELCCGALNYYRAFCWIQPT